MARQSKPKLGFPNLVYLSTLSGGRWKSGDMSLSALHDPIDGHVARTASTASADTQLVVRLDRQREVGLVTVLAHTMTVQAQMIVQAYADAEMTDPVYNAEGAAVDVFPVMYQWGDIPFGEPNWWTMRPLEEDIRATKAGVALLLPEPVRAQAVRIRFLDSENPDGVLDIGKVCVSPVFEVPHHHAYGGAMVPIDESRMSQSLGGDRSYDKRRVRRRYTMPFQMLREDREFARWFDLLSRAGITEEVFVMPEPDDLPNLQRWSFCGTFREPTPLERAAYRHMSASLVLEEN